MQLVFNDFPIFYSVSIRGIMDEELRLNEHFSIFSLTIR